jgi:hypothetical protein
LESRAQKSLISREVWIQMRTLIWCLICLRLLAWVNEIFEGSVEISIQCCGINIMHSPVASTQTQILQELTI